VTSYHEILQQYCDMIDKFKNDWVSIEESIEILTQAVMDENLTEIEVILKKLRI